MPACERKADALLLRAAASVAGNVFCRSGLIVITRATLRRNFSRSKDAKTQGVRRQALTTNAEAFLVYSIRMITEVEPIPAAVVQRSRDVASERLQTDSRILAYTRWDIIPVAAALLHCAYFFGMFCLFPYVPLWVMLALGFTYSVSISWNINGISHNFIHNPYFRSPLLNRLFSILESVTVGFSQVFYECIHMQHHKGNADRPDESGDMIDWISIYKHGHDGEAESALSYTFLSFFREDPKTAYRELKRKSRREAFWGVTELTLFVSNFVILGILNWPYICFLLPFWYFGHCLSYLNGYYRHYGGNPDEPMA